MTYAVLRQLLSSRTRGHVFVVMLAYRIVQELSHRWREVNLTVEEGIQELPRRFVLGPHRVPEVRRHAQRYSRTPRIERLRGRSFT